MSETSQRSREYFLVGNTSVNHREKASTTNKFCARGLKTGIDSSTEGRFVRKGELCAGVISVLP